VDEGKQFSVKSINLIGENADAVETASKDLLLKVGQVYNQNFIDLFVAKHPVASVDKSQITLHLNEKEGTADVSLDLRHCQAQ